MTMTGVSSAGARCIVPASNSPDKFQLFGISIDNITMDDAVSEICQRAAGIAQHRYAFVNADCLNHANNNVAYGRVLSRQTRVFADGSGVALAARMNHVKVRGNVNGTDMFPRLCEHAARRGLRIFLLGGGEGIAQRAADKMQSYYPDLNICGVRDGYIDGDETTAVIESINKCSPDILLVGMGAPRQEMWIEKHADQITAKVLMGVGGLFDYYSGRIPRAPLFLRKLGCEWTWRLMQEPSRLFKRYILGNPVFVARAVLDRLAAKRARRLAGKSVKARARAVSQAWTRRRRWRDAIKRTIDIAGAGTGLALLSPVLAATALMIRLESKGPVLFSQVRIGKDGEEFKIWKFRSMYIDAEERRAKLLAASDRTGSHFKMKKDPRITRVGKVIRRLSIDELPQLWNVVNGTMSIVGPRPNLPAEVAKYRVEELERLKTKPGITCTWQVSGRADLPWDKQIELDLDYVYEPSLMSDISLMAKTVPAVLSGKGAY